MTITIILNCSPLPSAPVAPSRPGRKPKPFIPSGAFHFMNYSDTGASDVRALSNLGWNQTKIATAVQALHDGNAHLAISTLTVYIGQDMNWLARSKA